MISKHVLQIFALLAVFVVILVPFSAAAGEDVVEHTVQVKIDPEDADQYDKIVNLADPENAITNPDTWTPSPRGIWTGAGTEESLFQFDDVLPASNQFCVITSVNFNSTQIMNGASVTAIRSPIASENVLEMSLIVWRLGEPGWEVTGVTPGQYGYPIIEGDLNTVAEVFSINMTDTSVTAGDDCWTVDGRTYVLLHAPLYSGVEYIFQWSAQYEADCRPSIYITSQDVASDGLMRTCAAIRYASAPDEVTSHVHDLAIDPGISYDMWQGLGSGIYAESVYMKAGDTLKFYPRPISYPGFDAYHTIMIPFSTEDGTLKASVSIDVSDTGEPWVADRTEWTEYILSSSPEQFGSVMAGYWGAITVTILEAVRVNWLLIDSPLGGDVLDARNSAYMNIGDVDHTIYARPWHSYQMSVERVFAPSVDPEDFIPMVEVQENQPVKNIGLYIGTLMYMIGSTMVSRGIVIAPALLLMQGGATMMAWSKFLENEAGEGPIEQIIASIRNAINAVKQALEAIGNFLLMIGEAIYGAIMWLADAISEYGAVLLGLLIIAVALGIFFMAIFVQLKLWGITWRMAEGDLQKAAAQAQGLASHGQGVVGKLRGRI